MYVVDAHIHLWNRLPQWRGYAETPERAFGDVVVEGKSTPMLPPSFTDSTSTAELALAHMDRCGVDRALIVQETLDGFLDTVAIDAVERYPDRFVGESLPDPRRGDNAADELDRVFSETPLAGVKIPVDGMRALVPEFNVDGGQAFQWFGVCRKHNAFVTIHPSAPAAFAEPMRTAAESFPEVNFIVAHGGLPAEGRWTEVLDLGRLPNVHFDISALPWVFGEQYPCARSAAAVHRMVETIGPDKILWGSDYPRMLTRLTYEQMMELVTVECRGLTEEDVAAIMGGNAERLFTAAGLARPGGGAR